MMKKIFYFFGALVILLPFGAQANFNVSQWKYYKEIKNFGGEVTKFTIDDEIFSGANKNLSDLRIVDNSEKETPFKILSGKTNASDTTYQAQLINNSYIPGQYSTAIIDLGGGGKTTNSVTINTNAQNFQRNVKILGSDDMNNWNILKDNAYIYDYTDKRAGIRTKNTSVSFPDSIFRYIKLEIADSGEVPVKISSVSIRRSVAAENREMSRQLNVSASEDSQRKLTVLISDMGQDGIPVSRLSLQTGEKNFNRGVIVYSSRDKDVWKTLGQGYVFRYSTSRFSGENLAIGFQESNDRYYKIEIINNDNAPLDINSMTAYSAYREIAFQPENGKTYKIFYGNAKADYPRYDLDAYFQYLDAGNAKLASLSPQTENMKFVPEKEPEKPISERWPYFFSIVIIIASLIILFLVYKFFQTS